MPVNHGRGNYTVLILTSTNPAALFSRSGFDEYPTDIEQNIVKSEAAELFPNIKLIIKVVESYKGE